MFVRSVLVVVACIFAIATSVSAGDLTEEQKEIFQKARSGHLVTEDMHRRFWDQFSEEDRAATRQGATTVAYVALMDQLSAAYTWSLYETQETGRPTKAPELEVARSKLLSLPLDDSGRKYWADYFAEQDRNLDPAALRQKASTTDRPWRLFSLANSRLAMAGREAVLFNPVWDDTLRSWRYPPMRLSLKWPYRWAGGCGSAFKCAKWGIGQRVDDTGSMDVCRYTNVADRKVVLPLSGVSFCAYEIDNPPSSKTISHSSEELEWQGYQSVRHLSVVDIGLNITKREYRITRIVFDPDHKAAWLLSAASYASLTEAEVLFDRLEAAIELEGP